MMSPTPPISRTGWQIIALTAALLMLAMMLAAALIASTGGSPSAAVQAMWAGSMADSTAWTVTLLSAAPVLLVAVGTCICAAAGTFNIGQEGQVLIGGLAGALIGMRAPYDGSMLVVAVLVCGAVGGALWASVSAVIYHYRQVNVAVSTLLMTFIAVQVVSFAVTSPSILQEEGQGKSKIAGATSDQLAVNGQLRSLGEYPGLQINIGLIIAVVLTGCVAVALTRTRWGLCLRLIGLNRLTAQHAGVRVGLMAGLALALSGAFAGLAGAVLLASPVGTNRLQAGLANNVGWDGLLVALVARNRPILCLPVALLFGVLRAGGDFLSSSGVPFFLVDVVKALLVLAFVAPPVLIAALHKRSASVPVSSPIPVEPISNEKVPV